MPELGDEKIVVFEDGKYAEVEKDVSRHPSFCGFGLLFAVSRANKQAASPRAEGGKSDKQQETPIPPAVKDITGDEHKSVLKTQLESVVYVRVPDCPVNEEYKGQKERKFN